MPKYLYKKKSRYSYGKGNLGFVSAKKKFTAKKKTYYRKSSYRKKRAGLMKFKKSMRRPIVGIQYKSVQMKAQLPIKIRLTAANLGMAMNYGLQFRRFGCSVNGLTYNTVGVEQCAGFEDLFKRYREVAFMGLKVEWHPSLFQQELVAGQGGQNTNKPILIRNNTWFDTISETIKGAAGSEGASAQQYRPGVTVPFPDMQLRRQTLQRHKPTAGWTKSVTNATYARQQNLEWFQTKDFYSNQPPLPVTPDNPGDIPNPMLRHDLVFDGQEASLPNSWPKDTVIGSYFITYSLKFRGVKDAEAE